MKYIVLLGDGMADLSCQELNNKTPLEYASKPNMDWVAAQGAAGMVKTVPQGFSPGSDVANLSVMGYDPGEYYSGRSPLEAVSMGVQLNSQQTAFRCNLVTLSGSEAYEEKVMLDYSAGEISNAEAAQLIGDIQATLGNERIRFYPGISYRHLMVMDNAQGSGELTPPHDISDRVVGNFLPRWEGEDILLDMMRRSFGLLEQHPVNIKRVQEGKSPANSLWFWGQGKKPFLPGFGEKYGLNGAVISAVDLIKGIGICAGLEVIEVEGATGNIHTNFRGKALAALKALEEGKDFIYIHVEAPDEAGHQGDVKLKVSAIEEIDSKVLGPLLEGLDRIGPYRLMLLPDHPTPLSTKTHSSDPVPFVIYDSVNKGKGGIAAYTEKMAAGTGLLVEKGHLLMDAFIKGSL